MTESSGPRTEAGRDLLAATSDLAADMPLELGERLVKATWTLILMIEAEAAPLDVDMLAQVLKVEGFVRGVASRYGTFNDVYWEKSAEAILARLAPEGTTVVDPR